MKKPSTIMALEKTTSAFLRLLEKDITAGRNIGDLPPRLLAEMRRAMKEVRFDLNEELVISAPTRRRNRSAS